MLEVPIGQANILTADVVKASDNSPIVSGTVAAYLYCKSGTHGDTWWDGTEFVDHIASAGNMTHRAGDTNGQWDISVAAGAWDDVGATFNFTWVESNSYHIPVSIDIKAVAGIGGGTPSLGD